MEVTHRKRLAQAAQEFIVQRWLERGRPPIDTEFLEAVHSEMAEHLGNDTMSPAAVARVLADEGAELRHPQIVAVDVRWRAALVESRMKKFEAVERLSCGARLTLEEARVLICNLEKLRQEFEHADDAMRLDELRTLAVAARQRAEAMGKNPNADAAIRREQSEVAEWLKVWLQTPALFENWLELRRRSEEFRRTFLQT